MHRRKELQRIIQGLAIALMLVHFARADEPAAGKQVEQLFTAKDTGQVPYLLYLPNDFKSGKSTWPLMLFLHGRGESNGPLSTVAKWGPPQLASRGESFPFIIVSPQCPASDNWSSAIQQTRITELLDAVITKYGADKSRIYLTGLSMGGSGSWRLAADHPQRFAAVVPICGRGRNEDAEKLAKVPIWVFCGDRDGVYQANTELVESIRKAGGKTIRYTTLENIGHNSWSAAYSSPDLYTWLANPTK